MATNSADDRGPGQARPLDSSLTLSKETARGFVDRANRFQLDTEGSMVADRWVSDWCNVRILSASTEENTR